MLIFEGNEFDRCRLKLQEPDDKPEIVVTGQCFPSHLHISSGVIYNSDHYFRSFHCIDNWYRGGYKIHARSMFSLRLSHRRDLGWLSSKLKKTYPWKYRSQVARPVSKRLPSRFRYQSNWMAEETKSAKTNQRKGLNSFEWMDNSSWPEAQASSSRFGSAGKASNRSVIESDGSEYWNCAWSIWALEVQASEPENGTIFHFRNDNRAEVFWKLKRLGQCCRVRCPCLSIIRRLRSGPRVTWSYCPWKWWTFVHLSDRFRGWERVRLIDPRSWKPRRPNRGKACAFSETDIMAKASVPEGKLLIRQTSLMYLRYHTIFPIIRSILKEQVPSQPSDHLLASFWMASDSLGHLTDLIGLRSRARPQLISHI